MERLLTQDETLEDSFEKSIRPDNLDEYICVGLYE